MRQLLRVAGRDVEREDLIRLLTVRPRAQVAEGDGSSIGAHGDYEEVGHGNASNRRQGPGA